MCVPANEARLEPGLPIDDIETRLVSSARRHDLEERSIAYWLHEIDSRQLHVKRGFSSIGDYAMELIGIKPRKARYLVFIASRLESLPGIGAAFDAGELSWTKAREIVRVATPETEGLWLERAKRLTNRELEKEIQTQEGHASEEFVTFTLSMPKSLLPMWNDCYELAERVFASELEKWQVLEPMMAEFMSTYLAEAADARAGSFESEDERALPPELKNAVFDRDGWQCAAPGCSMRKMLDPHHIIHRSQGGRDEPENLVTLCRMHHELIHRGVCTLRGRAGIDLVFERPKLVTERAPGARPLAPAEASSGPDSRAQAMAMEDEEAWREENVAAIFDGPPTPKPKPRPKPGDLGDFYAWWCDQKLARDLELRARQRRQNFDRPPSPSDALWHTCATRRRVARSSEATPCSSVQQGTSPTTRDAAASPKARSAPRPDPTMWTAWHTCATRRRAAKSDESHQ